MYKVINDESGEERFLDYDAIKDFAAKFVNIDKDSVAYERFDEKKIIKVCVSFGYSVYQKR